MATFTFSFASSQLSSPSSHFFLPIRFRRVPSHQHRFGLFDSNTWRPRLLPPLKCSSSTSSDAETEKENKIPVNSSSSSAAAAAGDWTNKLSAGIAGIGFLESSYLTYLKLTGSEAFCPVGGNTCGDILNSDYAFVFGVPLPLIGMAAYGIVALLGLQLGTRKLLPFGIDKSNAQLLLLGTATSMAAASAYFLYILATKFSGSTCSYCLLSAFLSFSLFFVTVKDLGLQETNKQVGLQLFIASLVILTLNTSYSNSKSASRLNFSSKALPEIGSVLLLPAPFGDETMVITSPSSSFALSLARHLHSIGAKMYGAFWCSHCLEQKEMFGREAFKQLEIVECFPEGVHPGIKMNKACIDAKVEGFPMWIINGQVLSGEQELSELARVSGYNESVQPS